MPITIISHSRKGMVQRQKRIIDHISRQVEKGKHGTDQNIKDAFKEYEKSARKGGLIEKDVKVYPDNV